MAKKKKSSGSGFLAGLVFGIVIGAVAVWVLTPQPSEVETLKARTNGADGATDAYSADGGTSATIVDIAMAAVERVRGRFGEAVALGREAYEQGQAEVKQRFNQARSAE
ncbi:MAG TPA: hypothetical protein VFN78_10895 [Ktedonobacterales bacterium]|nr:hypothetical protein [Ktedonobacterales bacterium]